MLNKEVIYKPNQRFEVNLLNVWKELFTNINLSKDMILQLFKRDFTGQYKKSFIGLGWAVITPLFGIASWVLMQFTGILTPGDVGVPYPIYILVGTTMWNLFMGILGSSSSTLSSAGGLLQQVKFPHEAFLIEQILLQLSNFMITFIMILIGISIFGVIPKWQIIFVPILILPVIFISASFGLLLSMITIVAVDISNFVNKILNFLIYTVPVIYSSTIENELLQFANKWNPLTYLICSLRDLVLYGSIYNFEGLIISSILSFVVFTFVLRAFYTIEDRLIERMI